MTESTKALVVGVFLIASLASNMWLTMRSLNQSTELSKLAANVESMRASSREQLDLAAAARRSLEEQLKDVGDAGKALAKTVREQRSKNEAEHTESAAAAKDAAAAVATELKGEIEKLATRMAALDATGSDVINGPNGVRATSEKLETLSSTLSQQEDVLADLSTRSNDTMGVLQALVEQVVSIKDEFNIHTSTPHLKEHPVQHALPHHTAAATATTATSAAVSSASSAARTAEGSSPPPSVVARPPTPPPMPKHANGHAAAAAEASMVEEAVAKAKAQDSFAVSSSAAAAAEVAPDAAQLGDDSESEAAVTAAAASLESVSLNSTAGEVAAAGDIAASAASESEPDPKNQADSVATDGNAAVAPVHADGDAAAPELEKAVDSEKTEETQAEEAQAEDTEAAAADDEEEDDEVADADAEVEAEGAALGESNRAKAASALEEDA